MSTSTSPPPQARLKMVHTVEINADPYRHSVTAEASADEGIKKNGDTSKSKSKSTCCRVLGVIIGMILIAVVTAFSICYSNHKCKFRKIYKCTLTSIRLYSFCKYEFHVHYYRCIYCFMLQQLEYAGTNSWKLVSIRFRLRQVVAYMFYVLISSIPLFISF